MCIDLPQAHASKRSKGPRGPDANPLNNVTNSSVSRFIHSYSVPVLCILLKASNSSIRLDRLVSRPAGSIPKAPLPPQPGQSSQSTTAQSTAAMRPVGGSTHSTQAGPAPRLSAQSTAANVQSVGGSARSTQAGQASTSSRKGKERGTSFITVRLHTFIRFLYHAASDAHSLFDDDDDIDNVVHHERRPNTSRYDDEDSDNDQHVEPDDPDADHSYEGETFDNDEEHAITKVLASRFTTRPQGKLDALLGLLLG